MFSSEKNVYLGVIGEGFYIVSYSTLNMLRFDMKNEKFLQKSGSNPRGQDFV